MKYKTFRNILVLSGVGAVGYGLGHLPSASEKPVVQNAPVQESRQTENVPVQPATGNTQNTPQPLAAADANGVDGAMEQALRQSVRDKIKDAIKGRAFKINLYSDDGARWNRAKVDLDRDDKWDEKWTFKPDGSVEKQVAPQDDENYTETFVRTDGQWHKL
jgi:hypothetical protein